MRRKLIPCVTCLVVLSTFSSTKTSAQEPGNDQGPQAKQQSQSPSFDDSLSELLGEGTAPAETAEPGAASPNVAPEAQATAAPRRGGSRLVEEIVVTAQKREENIQDVPITVQAFSGGMLDALGVQTTQDLQLVTPSLNFGEFVGYSIIFLRGVGTDAFLTADPSITTYVDGVYLPFSFGQTADFGSIERVEVLKGPQGTLFGRNAVGGAISVYTADPSYDAATLDVSLSYGRFNDSIVKATANLPVTDNFALSISGNYHRNDFYYDGTYATDPSSAGIRSYGPELGRGFRVKGLWQISDTVDFMGAFAYNDFNGYSTSVTPVIDPSLLASLLGSRPEEDDYHADLNDAGLGYFSRLAYGRLRWNPGPVDIKVSGSRQYTGNYQFYDFDGSSAPIAEFDSASSDGSGVRATSAELQITSNSETPFSDNLEWVAGAYYFDSLAGFRNPATLYLNFLDPITNLLGPNSPLAPLLQQVQPLWDLLQQTPTGRIGFTSGVGTNSISGYLQATYHITDWAGVTLGGRYQVEKRDVSESGTLLEQQNGDFIQIIDRADQEATTKSFSPKVSLDFRPTDEVLLYASWQKATKSGTYNAVNIYDAIDYVDPEKITAYEIGIKSEIFNGLKFNAAAWYYKQKDLQVQFVSLLKGGAVTFETAGAARSRGVEFDLNWLAFPSVVDDLVVILSGAYVDATFTSYPDASGFNQTTGLLQQNLDFSGNRVPQAAKFTGSLQINKTFQVSGTSSVEVGGNVYHNSGFYWTAQNVDVTKEGTYTTLGANLSWFYEPRNLRVTVFGTNLTDERYDKQRFTSDFGTVHHQAAPVEYGMRVQTTFGGDR